MKVIFDLKPKADATKYYKVAFAKYISFVVSTPLLEEELLSFIRVRLPLDKIMNVITVKEILYHGCEFYHAVETKTLIGLSRLADILNTMTVEEQPIIKISYTV